MRAERDSKGNGRVYSITFVVSDASGNVATATTQVTVPHDQGARGAAQLGPGPGYAVTGSCAEGE